MAFVDGVVSKKWGGGSMKALLGVGFSLVAVLFVVGCGPSDYQKSVKILADMPANASPEQVAHQCSWVKKIGVLPAEYSSRCAQAYLAAAQDQIKSGNGSFAVENLKAAVALGADSKVIGRLQEQAQILVRVESAKAKAAQEAAEKANQAKAKKDSIVARKAYAELLRNKFLDDGADIKVDVRGSNAESLILTYALFNDVWSHRMLKPGGLAGEAFGLGFKKIELSDGYNYNVELTPVK